MNRKDFAKILDDALEIAGAHKVRIVDEALFRRSIVHVLDRDQVLWRIQIDEPR